MSELTIKLDRIHIYEVDISNPPFDPDALSKREIEELDAVNDEFINTKLIPMLKSRAICNCRTPEIIARAERRARLIGDPNPRARIVPTAEQSDIDTMRFFAVIESENGKYTRILHVIYNCDICGAISFIGDAAPIARLVAETYTNYTGLDTGSTNDELIDGSEIPEPEE